MAIRFNQAKRVEAIETIIGNLPAFVLLDSDHRIILASPAIRNTENRGSSLTGGGYCPKLLCGIEPCEVCRTRLALETAKVQSFTFSVSDGASGERHLRHQAIPVIDERGVRQVLVVLTDVTDEVNMRNRLQHAEKLSAVGEMAAVLSHGFRNSLTSVKMILQLHLESSNSDEPEAEDLKTALQSVTNMERVVGDLLRFANNRQPVKQKQDINAVIRETIELSRYRFPGQNPRLVLELDPSLPIVNFDESMVKEAVTNLIHNACDAMKSGGEIRVKTGRNHLGDVSVREDQSHDVGIPAVSIEVSDEGEGIRPQVIERVFDPFFTTKVNGTGLGLTIVKRFIEDHGGTVRVENLDRGCRFELIIPVGDVGTR